MKIIVTGGAGFIGSHIVDKLINDGHEVVCIDDKSAPQNDQFHWNKAAINVVGDIRDESLRNHYNGADAIFHLAARSRIQPTVDNPSESFSVNVLGTQSVLEAARIFGVKRVIYSSSSSYYGNVNTVPFNEDMKPGCATPYSLSKFQGEQICDLYTRLYRISTLSLRYFNVYGPREPLKGQYAPVVGLFLNQSQKNLPITIVGDGEQRRDFTHINDVVEANIKALDKLDVTGVINVGTGKNYSINDIANIIGGNKVYLPLRVGETRVTLANNAKAQKMLGWNPTIDIIDYIRGMKNKNV